MGDLVFDIGMHNGDDTAYYLHRGYRVVAVEANPALCAAARERFAPQIAEGRLSIRNVGIAETRGKMEFWVSSNTEWSSFHAENATKGGQQATSMNVETMPFSELIAEEGTPFFVKIDIEMNDSLCLRDLAATPARPPYLSFESNAHADADITLLAGMGYGSFKCVRQNDLSEITPGNVVYQQESRRALKQFARLPGRRVRTIPARIHYRRRPLGGWVFNHGSSGPLGFELPGRWITCDEILSVWHQLVAYDLRLHGGGLSEWYDIHAAHGKHPAA